MRFFIIILFAFSNLAFSFEYNGSLSDDFNLDYLDESKWYPYNPNWRGRFPSLFSPDNVTVRDGFLRIRARQANASESIDGFSFSTGSVVSKALLHYGVVEARVKAMPSKASSAFWLYRDSPDNWTEIDVFEIGGLGAQIVNFNAHVFRLNGNVVFGKRGSKYHSELDSGVSLSSDFHVYRLEWTKDYIKWFFDGSLVRVVSNDHWHYPLNIVFDSEVFLDWFGAPEDKELPAYFEVDYIKVWN